MDLDKAEEPEIKLPISVGSSKKQEFQKNIYFCFIGYIKVCVDHIKLWKILKEMGIPDSRETCMQVKKQQLEPDKEQTGSKVGKEYVKIVCCCSTYI